MIVIMIRAIFSIIVAVLFGFIWISYIVELGNTGVIQLAPCPSGTAMLLLLATIPAGIAGLLLGNKLISLLKLED